MKIGNFIVIAPSPTCSRLRSLTVDSRLRDNGGRTEFLHVRDRHAVEEAIDAVLVVDYPIGTSRGHVLNSHHGIILLLGQFQHSLKSDYFSRRLFVSETILVGYRISPRENACQYKNFRLNSNALRN